MDILIANRVLYRIVCENFANYLQMVMQQAACYWHDSGNYLTQIHLILKVYLVF